MREIKFRIWHKKENRWLDPWAEEDPILSLKDYGRGCEVFLYDRKSKEHSNLNCQMDDVVIQQYTGLKDKNGVEIYEGDVVSIWQSGWNCGGMGDKMVQETVEFKNGGFTNCFHVTGRIEVIGNIFEGVDK